MFGTSTRYGTKIPPPPALIKRLTSAETRQVRSKLKAAAYGMNGVDWHKLFSHYDRDNGGELDFHEFKRALRSDAKISVSMLPNSQVHHLFNTIDTDNGGTIDVDELITWIEAGEDSGNGRRRQRRLSSGYGRVSPTEMSSPSQRRFDSYRGAWLHTNDEHSTAEGAALRHEVDQGTEEGANNSVQSIENAITHAQAALMHSHDHPIVLNKPPSPSQRLTQHLAHQTTSAFSSTTTSISRTKGGQAPPPSPEVYRLLREKDAQDALIESQANQLQMLKLLVSQQYDALSPKAQKSSLPSPFSDAADTANTANTATTAITANTANTANTAPNTQANEKQPPIAPHTMTFQCECHCGANRASFQCDVRLPITCWECNCSDCAMRRNLHFVVPRSALTILQGNDDASSTLYQWGTKTAIRRFCNTCGVLPWYVPRSNPDGYGITLGCVDWGSGARPSIVVKQYDGVHWQRSHAETNISAESKTERNPGSSRSPSRTSVISSMSEYDVEL